MITFKHVSISGSMHHCECCGSYCASGDAIYVNDEMVWEKYFDGHMGGRQTENTLVSCVLKAWYEAKLYNLEAHYSEEGRAKWNLKNPGNYIASTVESWNERKQEDIKMLNADYEQIAKDCENLPYDELLQIKMIALWIESSTGEKIAIEEDNHYEDDGLDYDEAYYSDED